MQSSNPPVEGEGEGEGEPQVGVPVVISYAVVIDGKTYVSAGDHTITVTFPAPVAGVVTANITDCKGDYSKAIDAVGTSVVLSPDATNKIWTGSGTFTATGAALCCASYVEIIPGDCSEVVCIALPVIVDGCLPYAEIKVSVADCTYAGCALNFASTSEDVNGENELCCGDDCSGSASWTINLYEGNPFETSCDPTYFFEEPIASDSGVCPIDFTTECLDVGTYYAVISLVDNVGLEQNYYAKIEVSGGETDTDCSIVVMEGFEATAPICVTWTEAGDTIGTCEAICMD